MSPTRQALGLAPRQRMTPELEERLCMTALHACSFERAAAVAEAYGVEVDDSAIHRAVQAAGNRARQAQDRRVRDLKVPARREELSQEGSRRLEGARPGLVLMADGWMVRERGAGWGRKRTKKPRVSWHEVKTGIVFRMDHLAHGGTAPGEKRRGQVLEKSVVAHVGEPEVLAGLLRVEALRRGIEHVPAHCWTSDGGPWTWGIQETYFPQAVQTLDFYHASKHMHAFTRDLKGEEQGPPLAASLLHDLRHGRETRARHRMACLAGKADRAGIPEQADRDRARGNIEYLEKHRHRICYKKREKEGWPIGSGVMEATCSELQGRFKRPGQFWTPKGRANLMALEQARRNRDWQGLWNGNLQQE